MSAAAAILAVLRTLFAGAALPAAVAGVAVFIAMRSFDAAIDDPAVRREATRACVARAAYEGEIARRQAAEALLALAEEKRAELVRLRQSDAAALAAFEQARRAAEEKNEELTHALDDLAGDVPVVGDHARRLRNR